MTSTADTPLSRLPSAAVAPEHRAASASRDPGAGTPAGHGAGPPRAAVSGAGPVLPPLAIAAGADEQAIAASLRACLRRLAASVAIVTTRESDATPVGLTVSSITSVTLEPPALLVCIHGQARAHGPLAAGAPFAVNYLSQAHSAVSDAFAFGPDMAARFAAGRWHAAPAELWHLPVLEGALAVALCAPHATLAVGTHTIVVGRVAAVIPGAGDDLPLLWHEGGYGALAPLLPPA